MIGSLFAGIGGLELGLERAGLGPTVWQVENDPHCVDILERHWPDVARYGDITELDWTDVEPVDVMCGGFPCQDISKAGKGEGIDGERSGLWRHYADAIRVLRPRLAVVEQVPALTRRGLDRVLGDLAEAGYDATWACLRAADVGAPHGRERLFVAAYPQTVGDTYGTGSQGHRRPVERLGERPVAPSGGPASSDAGRQRHGAGENPGRVDRRDASEARQRQRSRQVAGDRSAPASADADGFGRLDRRAREPHAGRQAVDAERGGSSRRRWVADYGGRTVDYEPAVRRWEATLGRPAPEPVVDGCLSFGFVEWMMGFPEGWTSGMTRSHRGRALGNAVVPQVAEVIGVWAASLVDVEVAA